MRRSLSDWRSREEHDKVDILCNAHDLCGRRDLIVLLDASLVCGTPAFVHLCPGSESPEDSIASEQCYLLAVYSSVYALALAPVERVSARAPHGAPRRAPTG